MYRLQLTSTMDLADTKDIVANGKVDIKNRPYLITLEEVLISELTGISNHFMDLLQGNFFVNKEFFKKYSLFDKMLFDLLTENYDVHDSDKIVVLGATLDTQRQRIIAHSEDEMDAISESLTHKVVFETNIGMSPDYIIICLQNIVNEKKDYKVKYDGKNSKYTFYELPNDNTMGVLIASVK